MTYHGTVQNGIIVLEEGVTLPNGTPVTVVPVAPTVGDDDKAQPTAGGQNELTVGQKLAALGRWVETQPSDLPEDLAENHDHYIHGTPRSS